MNTSNPQHLVVKELGLLWCQGMAQRGLGAPPSLLQLIISNSPDTSESLLPHVAPSQGKHTGTHPCHR